MEQKIDNSGNEIQNQVNIQDNKGALIFKIQTRFSRRFEKLNEEVSKNERYDEIMESLQLYLTKLDGIDMPTKLQDGGFTDKEIENATRRKEKYAKKLEKNRFYESAQWIDSQLFAIIKINFETHVEPLIKLKKTKNEILKCLLDHVITPTLNIVNIEGEKDEVLNYDAEDILGMIYYLTGKCHINWKDYDNL